MANQADTYTTEAIACGLSDVAGWLENEGGREKHARTIRLGVERLRELGAAVRGAEHVGLERIPAQYRKKVAAVLAFTEEDWLLIKHCYPEEIERFRAVLVPASGTGEGSGGATPAGSGSHPSDHAPTDHGRPGFDPSRAWQDISTAPSDDRLILAGCPACAGFPEGRVMIWRASMLNRNQKGPTPHHLSFPATHWAPLLPAPKAGGRPENYRSEYRLAAWLVWFAQKQLAENRDWHARNRLRWAAEALIGENAVLALGIEARKGRDEGPVEDESPAPQGATPSPPPHPQAPNTLSEVEDLRSRATAAEDKLRDREAEIERLKIAFHDAIRRPLGVTPDSGAEFYDHRMADQAEERRAEARRARQEPGTGGER